MELNIGIIKGDGIGPEIVTEAMKVLDKVFEVYEKVPIGSNSKVEGNFKDLLENFEK